MNFRFLMSAIRNVNSAGAAVGEAVLRYGYIFEAEDSWQDGPAAGAQKQTEPKLRRFFLECYSFPVHREDDGASARRLLRTLSSVTMLPL
jgi:hypothetical protein